VVAEEERVAQRNSGSLYQHRYPTMPQPVIDLGERRVKLWLRSAIEAWAKHQEAEGRTKPARRAAR
jgi:predicted DNA-binding transcriptional regulator AlpA